MLASLIQTESIIWRKPAPANALPLLELAERQIVELATAKNTDEPDDKLIARLERELSDTLDELPEAEEIRITVRGATVADQARCAPSRWSGTPTIARWSAKIPAPRPTRK